jgi:hypothetical protein
MGIDKKYWENLKRSSDKPDAYPKLHSDTFFLIHGGEATYFGSNL